MAQEKKYPINPKEVEVEYQELAGRMNYDGSKYLPRLLKKAFSLEQAKLALAFEISSQEIAGILGISKEEAEGKAQKYQPEALAKKLNIKKEDVDKHIRYMFEVGFAFPTRRGWRWAKTAEQAKDSQSNPKFDQQLGDEYFDLWEAFQKIEAYPTSYVQRIAAYDSEGGPPRFRIIPARKSLKTVDGIVPEDNLEEVLKLYSTIAVEHCPCKRLVRDRSCHSPTEVCLIMDRVAEHNLRRGAARIVSVEEALEIHDRAAEAGLICMPQSNEARPTRLSMICHCHWCCCDPIAATLMTGYPLEKRVAASCYKAVVDPDKCNSCQVCVTACQFNAIEMKTYSPGEKQAKFKAWVNPEKCFGCGLCVIKCPAEARSMKMVKSGDSIPKEIQAPGGYTEAQAYKTGKHMDTGSVMIKPSF
jgi:ferredoxin/biotin operon repressor